jgi:hypothetical protein
MPVTINGTAGVTFNNSSVSSVGGVGDTQTWQTLTGSRANGTTYTNSTGKPISICFHSTEGGTGLLTVGGVVLNRASNNLWYTAIVPNGNTYVFNGNFSIWCELR